MLTSTNTMKRQTTFYIPKPRESVELSIIKERKKSLQKTERAWSGLLKKREEKNDFGEWRWVSVEGIVTNSNLFKWYSLRGHEECGEVCLANAEIAFEGENTFSLNGMTFSIENVACIDKCKSSLLNPVFRDYGDIQVCAHGSLENDSIQRASSPHDFSDMMPPVKSISWSDIPIVPYKTVDESRVESLSYKNLRRFPFGIPHATIGGKVLYAQAHHIANSLPHTLSQDFVRTKIDWSPVDREFPKTFNVYMEFKSRRYVLIATQTTTISSLIQEVLISSRIPIEPEEVMVKVGYHEEYVSDAKYLVSQLVYVRTQIANTKKIVFEIVDDNDLTTTIFSNTFSLNDSIEQISPQDIGDGYITKLLCKQISGKEKAYDGGSITNPLQVYISHIVSPKLEGGSRYFVTLGLEYGDSLLCDSVRSEIFDVAEIQSVEIQEWLCFNIPLKNIPPETMIKCDVMKVHPKGMLYGWIGQADETIGATVVSSHRMSLCEFYGTLKSGEHIIGTETKTHIHFDVTPKPILMRRSKILFRTPPTRRNASNRDELNALVQRYDMTYVLSPHEKKIVWSHKDIIRREYPDYLPMLLKSAHFNEPIVRDEVRTALRGWPDISPHASLELLSDAFPDVHVRIFAMHQLMNLATPAFIEFLPQIVNCIRHEPYTFNAISYYVLIRASQSLEVGNTLFWLLYSQLNLNLLPYRSGVSPYKIILGVLIELCSSKTADKLHTSLKVIKDLTALSKKLSATDKINRDMTFFHELEKIDFENFTLPINPKFCAQEVIVSECKVMTSNAAPLWLVFKNEYGKKSKMIFKIGDDMRVDMYALQIMRVMEYEWNLDDEVDPLGISLQTYKACAVGESAGVIEVVDDCMTNAAISSGSKKNRSSSFTFTNAFSNEALYEWLREHNETPRAFEKAQQTFMKSCAGYCVATYLLGVGDRHNDNIMCTSSGSVFHIDFGYFFGQKVTVGGIVPKETAPFVLTREFVTVMGGEDSELFKNFVELCKNAFLYLRRRYKIFITLTQSLRGNGCIPQLADNVSSHYITEKFMLDETERGASSHFEYLIQSALGSNVTRLNFAMHMFASDFSRMKLW